jgi:hypothetical protein
MHIEYNQWKSMTKLLGSGSCIYNHILKQQHYNSDRTGNFIEELYFEIDAH